MRFGRSVAASAALIVAVTALAYLTFFAWDTSYDVDPVTGYESGPYQPWQVIGCAAILVALAALTARFGAHPALVFLISTTFTVCWVAQAATSSAGDGLWPVGAILIAIGTSTGAALFLLIPPSRKSRWRKAKNPS